jgi:hypothetical protein
MSRRNSNHGQRKAIETHGLCMEVLAQYKHITFPTLNLADFDVSNGCHVLMHRLYVIMSIV